MNISNLADSVAYGVSICLICEFIYSIVITPVSWFLRVLMKFWYTSS